MSYSYPLSSSSGSPTHLTYSLLDGSGDGLGSMSVFLGDHRQVGDDGFLDARQLLQSVQVVLANLVQLRHYIYGGRGMKSLAGLCTDEKNLKSCDRKGEGDQGGGGCIKRE